MVAPSIDRYHLRRPNMRFYQAPREGYDFSMTLEPRKWVFTQFIDFHCRRKKEEDGSFFSYIRQDNFFICSKRRMHGRLMKCKMARVTSRSILGNHISSHRPLFLYPETIAWFIFSTNSKRKNWRNSSLNRVSARVVMTRSLIVPCLLLLHRLLRVLHTHVGEGLDS